MKTAFHPEQSHSAITAGKILLQLKTLEPAAPGQAQVSYREQLQQLEQGLSEAILQERVPPGYHDAIQKYFDDLTKHE